MLGSRSSGKSSRRSMSNLGGGRFAEGFGAIGGRVYESICMGAVAVVVCILDCRESDG